MGRRESIECCDTRLQKSIMKYYFGREHQHTAWPLSTHRPPPPPRLIRYLYRRGSAQAASAARCPE